MPFEQINTDNIDNIDNIDNNKKKRTLCEHKRRKSICKECGGSSICQHEREKRRCRECGGASICEHNRERSKCKECKNKKIQISFQSPTSSVLLPEPQVSPPISLVLLQFHQYFHQ